MDRQTDRHTHGNYRNPRCACTPRVNKPGMYNTVEGEGSDIEECSGKSEKKKGDEVESKCCCVPLLYKPGMYNTVEGEGSDIEEWSGKSEKKGDEVESKCCCVLLLHHFTAGIYTGTSKTNKRREQSKIFKIKLEFIHLLM